MTREPQRSVSLLLYGSRIGSVHDELMMKATVCKTDERRVGRTKHNIISNAGWKQPDGQ